MGKKKEQLSLNNNKKIIKRKIMYSKKKNISTKISLFIHLCNKYFLSILYARYCAELENYNRKQKSHKCCLMEFTS